MSREAMASRDPVLPRDLGSDDDGSFLALPPPPKRVLKRYRAEVGLPKGVFSFREDISKRELQKEKKGGGSGDVKDKRRRDNEKERLSPRHGIFQVWGGHSTKGNILVWRRDPGRR